jgi:CxxC motif-containing protein (DUF1111 family)
LRAFAAALLVLAAAADSAVAADERVVMGKALFERDWLPGPGSEGGLGPLFTARSCAGCHAGDAFAARFTPAPGGRVAGRGLVVRFGDAEGRPDPVYGHVLQNQAVEGAAAEGRIVLSASAADEGGLVLKLHLDQGPLVAATRRSVRLAPPLIGRGDLERIDAAAVLARADPDDRDGDGVSGRPRLVDVDGVAALGRYGWKAGIANIEAQVADAFVTEVVLASDLRPLPQGDCTERQTACRAALLAGGAEPEDSEIPEDTIDLVAAFVRSLDAVTPPAETDGSLIFTEIGCAACHVPEMPATPGPPVRIFTDLLLHDMGESLDDGVGEPGAASAEWRTAPLVALAPQEGRRYLHDGRAASLEAAILEHGGEASSARVAYAALDDAERRALLYFLELL